MTDPNARITREGFESRAPRTAAEFAEYFNRSEFAQLNRADIAAYQRDAVGNEQRMSTYRSSVKAEHATTAHPKSPFIISIPMQVRALMVRRFQILKGGISVQVMQLM